MTEGQCGPKTIAEDVVVEDLAIGEGEEAKDGDVIYICYENRLGDKVISRYKNTDGFKLVLGEQTVIRAWDLGIIGMRVGSKRRIVCPPNVAYGEKGQPPIIPKNATIISEVEVLKIAHHQQN